MHCLFAALPFAVLSLLPANCHADELQHGSLGTHEHGVAQLNAALDGSVLELEFDSPAMNLVGFEHIATAPADQAKLAEVRKRLEQPLTLFALDTSAGCHVTVQTLESPLFGDKLLAEPDEDKHAGADRQQPGHSEIHAHYQLTCQNPGELKQISLAPLFQAFPATRRVQVQLIAPSGQQGLDATAASSLLAF